MVVTRSKTKNYIEKENNIEFLKMLRWDIRVINKNILKAKPNKQNGH